MLVDIRLLEVGMQLRCVRRGMPEGKYFGERRSVSLTEYVLNVPCLWRNQTLYSVL